MKAPQLTGILAWVVVVGILLVCLTITIVNLLDRLVIEQAAAQYLHAEFLRAADSVSRSLGPAQGIHDRKALHEAVHSILALRASIRRLEVFTVAADSADLILSSDPEHGSTPLSLEERTEVLAGRSMRHFDDAVLDRAWLITAPLTVNGRVVGALRGRYSLWKYDLLIKKEAELAKDVGIGAVAITCVIFLVLIRVKVHKPVNRLLNAMRLAEAGDWSATAPLAGPSDIQEVALQFNRLLGRVKETTAEKERLLDEIQSLNKTLVTNIGETTEELRQANALLVEARMQTERAQRLAALGEFSAMVAHELGTPLSSLSGHLQMLADDTDLPSKEHRLAIIRSEITRMTTIIQDILDSTQAQMHLSAVDLSQTVDEALALISPVLPSKSIALQTSLSARLPPAAGDRMAIKGLLYNLVTNAVQAMPKGGKLDITTIRVRTEPPEGKIVATGSPLLNRGAIRLTVRDTGLGIAPESLLNVFEPFFTTRSSGGGTGLGLAICHRVVSSCGGRLAIHSVVGQGTVFTIDLPIWSEDQ